MSWSSLRAHLTFDFTSTRFGLYHARLAALCRAVLEDMAVASELDKGDRNVTII